MPRSEQFAIKTHNPAVQFQIAKSALLVSLLVALSGCESFTEGSYLNSPSVGFLGGTEHIVLWDGEGRDVVNIAAEADLENLSTSCRISSKRTIVELAFDITVLNGVNSKAQTASLPFFVAVTSPLGEVLVKTSFMSHVSFKEGVSLVDQREAIVQEIVLSDRQPLPNSFEVLVGFQLSAEQLEMNLSRRNVR